MKKPISWQTAGLIAAGSVATVIWTIWATYGHQVAAFLSADPEVQPGPWGDTFGALNTLFGAVGFITVAFTLVAQRKALSLQQEEFAATRRDQHVQRFEETFFELLGLMRELRGNIFVRPIIAPGPDTGFYAIRNAVERVDMALLIPSQSPEAIRRQFQIAMHKMLADHGETGLGPYFRVIYTMLNRLREDAVLVKDEKDRLGNLLRSQLNGDEIILAAINGLSIEAKDFEALLTEYHMLKYMPASNLRSLLEMVYSPQAFSPRD